MSKSYKINGDLIKSSGQKLKTVGYLMIGNVGVFILYLLFILNASYADEIQIAGVLTAIISVIIAFLIIKNIIESGEGFIKSVEVMTEKKEQTGLLSDKDGNKDGLYEEFFKDGQLRVKGTIKNGNKDGIWEDYYENGKIWMIETYQNCELNGLWEEHFKDGQLKAKGKYLHGQKDGLWEFFNENGTLNTSQSGHYENGKRVKPL